MPSVSRDDRGVPVSNVTECIDLYLYDSECSDEMFRRFIAAAVIEDHLEHEQKVTQWHAIREARRELQELQRERA